jgi:hypothetical protein
LLAQNHYCRVPNRKRRKTEKQLYKKGWEVRLLARTENEAMELTRLARQVGFEPGRVFPKARQFVVPLYGRAAVTAFRRARAKRLRELVLQAEAPA